MKKKWILILIAAMIILLACNFPLLPKVKIPAILPQITLPSIKTLEPLLTMPALMTIESKITLPVLKTAEPPKTSPPAATKVNPSQAVPSQPVPSKIPIFGMKPTLPSQPDPADKNLTRSDLPLDLAEVIYSDSGPDRPLLHLGGNLPTPCHKLRVIIPKPDNKNRIMVEAYTLVDPKAMCIQIVMQFDQVFEFGELAGGNYSVWVNGKQIGDFKIP